MAPGSDGNIQTEPVRGYLAVWIELQIGEEWLPVSLLWYTGSPENSIFQNLLNMIVAGAIPEHSAGIRGVSDQAKSLMGKPYAYSGLLYCCLV
ncbi:MAG TPA: hypothetical protein VFE22_07940 [Edaphobacter sp.]|nr:hypothetical protein [Edaphobacter sp.]